MADAPKSGDTLKLFISYSRADMAAADALVSALEAEGFEVKIDRRDLPYGEEWQAELADFIRSSDTVVWLVSPDSIKSKWCNWELGEVGRLNKRLVPIKVRTVMPEELPEALGRIQLLPADGVYDPAHHLSLLVTSLETDRNWVKEATRLADRAREWIVRERSSSLLLRGIGLRDAEAWASQPPKAAPSPASEVLELILASRRGAVRRQRWAVGGALGIAVMGLGLAGLAWWQRDIAIQQRDTAMTTQSRLVADLANQRFDEHDAGSAILLALEGMADSIEGITRPNVPETESTLFRSLQDLHEIAVLAGHEDQVCGVAFSPDGRRVVTASRDRTARIWDVETRRVIAVLADSNPSFIWSANFSPDGRRIVTAAYMNGATIWDSSTGMPIRRLATHGGGTWDATFSPDGKRVVTTDDKTARIWDAETGRELEILNGHTGPVFSASFSPDGRRVVTASQDGSARIWDSGTGNEIRTLGGSGGRVFSAKFGPDGRQIVTASAGGSVRVWDGENGTETDKYTSHAGDAFSAAFSPDGRQIVSASRDKTSRVFDRESGIETVLAGHTAKVWAAAFSPDGKHVVTASEDGTARIWDVEPNTVFVVPGEDAESVAFSSDSRRALTGLRDGTAKIWDMKSRSLLTVLTGHTGPVVRASFSPDDRQILTASSDNTSRLWNSEDGKAESTNTIEGRTISTSFTADGPRVLTQTKDTIKVWDAISGTAIVTIADPGGRSALGLDGRRLATARVLSYSDPVRVWDVRNGKEIRKFEGHQGPVGSVAISADSRNVVSLGFEDFTARIWDSETGTVLARLPLPGRGEAASFSPDGRRVAIASSEFQIWEIASAKTVASFDLLKTGNVRYAVFSPDGRHLATVSDNNIVRIWPIFPAVDELVANAKQAVPRCLTGEQRLHAFLNQNPPAWCTKMAKWTGGPTVLMSKWKFN